MNVNIARKHKNRFAALSKGVPRLLAALAAATMIACSGNLGDERDRGGPETAAYLLGTRVWDDTSTTSYFHVVSSIEEGATTDESRAVEVPGAAKLYAVEGVGWFAIGGGEAPTITRYTLDDQGRLDAGETISLQNYGVESLWDTLYVVSPTKMYYPDRDGQRLIIINPSAMEITGEVDLGQTGREGFLSLYGYAHLERGSDLLFSVAWIDWNETDSILGETGLVVLDTETDEVSRFDVDARCGGITTPVQTGSGDVYFVSSALAAAAHRLGRLTTAPCALRVRAGDDSFDANYLESLEELTGSALVGEPVPGGGDGVFLRAFDEDLGIVADGALTWELTNQSAWRWLRWTPSTGGVLPVDALDPSTSDVLWFRLDGKVYGTETTEDYSETTLIELTADGGPRRALTAPGFLHGVARIR
ncbi:MAG: DUF4374 domain-containing protein [Myxococcota bacterium]|nr:DUF4374 domain-containing protein [Myxococcota bacterium]